MGAIDVLVYAAGINLRAPAEEVDLDDVARNFDVNTRSAFAMAQAVGKRLLAAGKPGSLEKHGNPNVLTPDRGTSRLAQGPIAHSALVEVERFDEDAPPVTAFAAPDVAKSA